MMTPRVSCNSAIVAADGPTPMDQRATATATATATRTTTTLKRVVGGERERAAHRHRDLIVDKVEQGPSKALLMPLHHLGRWRVGRTVSTG